ncbi:glycoside hydrolase family 16 protein [Nonomuraea sp. NN258]|uniref:glycoside hydrolase family 16 protein n=1 Tax=Nonomuraea antri TaxID=2730852 RepID=UPI001567CC62|nr:glycoside hydrolase family 16 protein [Nonomuraea antri]NRQ32322.1 glycoside hydrolase family 16 protein [Nonomuraea antri]
MGSGTKRSPAADGRGRSRSWALAIGTCVTVLAISAAGVRSLGEAAPVRPPSAPAPLQSIAPPPLALPAVRWKLSWSDEFAGRGTPAKWDALTGTAWSNRKALHYYSPSNAALDGSGHLVISAQRTGAAAPATPCWYGPCRYSSARLETRTSFAQAYGRFAARIKLPLGQGLWPAFWLKRVDAGRSGSATYGEIDIVENRGHEPRLVRGYTHSKDRKGGGKVYLPDRLDAGFHVYGVDWTPESITWWVDGEPYAQYPRYPGWPFDKPFYLILNLQVGGGWVGNPNATTRFPARMVVDWVRVYRQIGRG